MLKSVEFLKHGVPEALLNRVLCQPLWKHGSRYARRRMILPGSGRRGRNSDPGTRPLKAAQAPCRTGQTTLGKSTRWDRRGRGPGIWGQICRDRVGKMPLAAGAGSNLPRLLERGEEPKEGVTCHIVPPDVVRVFSGWFLGFFFGLTGGRWRRSAREWDRILARVGTTGIPAAEERKTGIWSARQKRPGGLRVLSPRPPLRDFTKEMACFLALYDG